MTDGMKCPDCEEKHSEWEDGGEYTVDDGHNAGIIARAKCGNCGEIVEVPRR